MKFVVAGGGVAGLASALAVARAGHHVVLTERDVVPAGPRPEEAFEVDRAGIPHYLQPHAFLPRGRRELKEWAPDVLEELIDVGAEPQDLAMKLEDSRSGDASDLIYLWARRPLIEWALRRAVAADPAVEIRAGAQIAGILTEGSTPLRATGVRLAHGETIRGDLVVDALGRYRPPPGWPRVKAEPTDSGAIYYCRYFRLADGVEHLDAPLLNPRGDLGFMGFNTFRGDNRTYAVIILTPTEDRELRMLRDERAWHAACSRIAPLDLMTSPEYGTPITPVMPMGGLMNIDRTATPGVQGVAAVGDALCHTDPAFAYGVSFALVHAKALADAASKGGDPEEISEPYREAVSPEARERYELACAIDGARARRWRGAPLDVTRRDGSYPLFSFMGALAAAPHDDEVLKATVRRIGLLDRTHVFDDATELHRRIETILERLETPPSPGPPREELVAHIEAAIV